ncbi:MAG: DUF4386 domain-containing protein [Candidatus Promineifilaceae bacterium]
MDIGMNTIRLLGAAQLFVFVTGIIGNQLLVSVVGSGSMSDKLVNISNNLTRVRISNLVTLVECVGIIVLGVLFYIVFNKEYEIIALVALGLFLAEAITLAVSKIGAYSLMPLSQEFVAAGAPEPSYFQTLGDFLYSGVDRLGYDIHLLFFALGGILWYYLFYISNYIPRLLSVWGLVAVCLFTIYILLTLYDRDFPPAVGILALPYLPYELFLGVWLIVKGFN